MDRLGVNAAPLRIGLTGGIGSGKTTVAAILVACGAQLVDTDAIARQLTQPGGTALPAIVEAFGPQSLAPGGALDREWMRKLVFADATAKARLEALLHPLIGEEALRQQAAGTGRPIVFDVPLLTESQGPRSWRSRVERVLVVDCNESTQLSRVAARPGWSEELARRVVAQQAPRATRRQVADAVIFNEGLDLEQLDAQVRSLWQLWVGPRAAD